MSAATDGSFNLTPEARRYLESTAGQRFADDGEAVAWAIQTLGGALSLEVQRRQERTGGVRLRFTPTQLDLVETIAARKFSSAQEAADWLVDHDKSQQRELEAKKTQLDRLQMEEAGRQLHRERLEREQAEDEGYDGDFARRFGERVRFSTRPPADAEEAERRAIGARLGIDPAKVI